MYFFVFVIPNLNSLKLGLLEVFFSMLLLYRGINDVVVSLFAMEPIGVGYILKYITYVILYASIIFALRNSPIKSQELFIKNFTNIFIISGIVNSVVIIIQFFYEYSIFYSSMNLLETFRFIRPISLMGVVTVNSMFIGFSIILLVSKYKYFKTTISKLFFFLLLFTLVLGELFTSSRGGFLILFLTFIHVLVINYNKFKISAKIMIRCSILFLILVVAYFITQDLILSYLENVFLSNSANASNDSRLSKWGLALDLFLQYPAFGVGTGNYNTIQSALTSGWSSSNPHNVLLQILSENGLIYTLLFYSILIYFFFKYHFKLRQTQYYPIYAVIVYWFYSSFYMSTLDNMVLGMSFVSMLAVIAGVNFKKLEEDD